MSKSDTFHFKEDFFEEILNGVPEENDDSSQKESNLSVLSPDKKLRVKNVAKAFLSTEESKKVFSTAVTKLKNKESKALLNKFSIDKIKEDAEEINDEEDEFIEESSENKPSSPVSKILALKTKYEKLKKISKKGLGLIKYITAIRAFFVTIGTMSFASAISNRNKVIREINGVIDDIYEKDLYPVFSNFIMNPISYSFFNLSGKFRRFIDNILEEYYDVLELALESLLVIETQVLAGIAAATGNFHVAAALEYALAAYKAKKWIQRGMTSIEYAAKIGYKFIKNPEILKEVLSGTKSGIIAFFGKLDDNAQTKINGLIHQGINQSKKAGDKILASLGNNSINNDYQNFLEDSRGLINSSEDLFGEFKNIANEKINDAMNVFERNTPRYKQYKYVYNIISRTYFKGVGNSPWTKMALNLNNMLIFVEKKFDKMYERWSNVINSNSGFIGKNKKVLTEDDLKRYFSRFVSTDDNRAHICVKSGDNKKFISSKKERFDFLKNCDVLILGAKTEEIYRYGDDISSYYAPKIIFYISPEIKESYLSKSKKNFRFKSVYYERRVNKSPNGGVTYTTKSLDKSTEINFEILSLTNKRIEIGDKTFNVVDIPNSHQFLKAINEKHYSPRGLILNRLFSPFSYKKMTPNDIDKSKKTYIKLKKSDFDYFSDESIYVDKDFDGTNYDDKRYTHYTGKDEDYYMYENCLADECGDKENDMIKANIGFGNMSLLKNINVFKRGYTDYDTSNNKTYTYEIKLNESHNITILDILSAEILFENFSKKRFENINERIEISNIMIEEFRDELVKGSFE